MHYLSRERFLINNLMSGPSQGTRSKNKILVHIASTNELRPLEVDGSLETEVDTQDNSTNTLKESDIDTHSSNCFNPQFRSTEQFSNDASLGTNLSAFDLSGCDNPFDRSQKILRSPTNTPDSKVVKFSIIPEKDDTIVQFNRSLSLPTNLNIFKQDGTMANLNCTIEAANAAEKTPRLPKFLNPDIYNPANGNALKFINDYERTSILNGWDLLHMINYFGLFLTGAAHLWYSKFKENPTNSTKTWSEIKNEFTTKFAGESSLRLAKIKLYNRKQQPTESIKNYFYDLTILAEDYNPAMKDEDFIDHFENGLNQKFLQMYCTLRQSNMKISQLEDIVHKLSNWEERSQNTELPQLMTLLNMNNDHQPTTENTNIFSRYRNRQFPGNSTNKPATNIPYCNNCGKSGHYTSACWYNRNKNFPPQRNLSENNFRPVNQTHASFRNPNISSRTFQRTFTSRGGKNQNSTYPNRSSNVNQNYFRGSSFRGRGGTTYNQNSFYKTNNSPNGGGQRQK